ncbi:tRNA glutamyl-Q(34) synthetase GluQRS [Polynucleobacter sp. JS-Polo-80-F4]|uniref:tRNA glutamyl-Q(34) synthetase GluQRS n=1 Tax=Polynucleobacter sp. JS-Polo-80-F4 TaxID=2576918 RepID=UPI001C0D6010|nr:tRNA glutamyl-Q(34) synthetase GluQRS [Polynucleobacter sp. JS-Polo-80-F4]MBU3615824.1 tRNA glutamyl-Q(34) synthetase GluQRS [Polynucleobacter sp. JS-Polo-80-F4]
MILAVSKLKNPSSPAGGYRGRFAPSPTGPLHAGSLVAALGSWLDARKNGGKWLLRIEDLDTPRCIPEASQQIQSQLLACGLSWDEEVIHQSQRNEAYLRALERLNGLECLYSCTCSRQMIANTLASLGIETPRNQEMVYPGTCRPTNLSRKSPESFGELQQAWRIALPSNCHIEFEDLALGPQSQNLSEEVGDFVLRRSDGLFTYQLAVVVDDAEQKITHVVRGQDLLSNTARQIYLQEVLGYKRPEYLHLPLVLDEHGEKLSKQTLATQINTQDEKCSLMELRKAAKHLGLKNLPDGENVTIAEWLLAATHAWRS